MMKIRLIYFTLVFNCFIYFTCAQTFICNSINGYNTKHLTTATQWLMKADQCLTNPAAPCTFYLSFCQTAPMCFNEYSACENSSISSNVTIIGGYSTKIFFENPSVNTGFYALFPKGPKQNITNTTACEPSLKIQFKCNLNAKWFAPISNTTAVAPDPTDIDIKSDECQTILTFDYDGACYNGNEEPKDKLNGGAIFIIILVVVISAYLIVGVAYNGLVKKERGKNMIPHAQFWLSVPIYSIMGCRTIISCCTGSTQPSPSKYESV